MRLSLHSSLMYDNMNEPLRSWVHERYTLPERRFPVKVKLYRTDEPFTYEVDVIIPAACGARERVIPLGEFDSGAIW